MPERSERVQNPVTYEFHAAIFACPCVLLDRPPVLWGYHLERGGMPLHDALGINYKKGSTTDIKA